MPDCCLCLNVFAENFLCYKYPMHDIESDMNLTDESLYASLLYMIINFMIDKNNHSVTF